MTAAALDRLLAILVVALAATGLLSLRAGNAADAWLFLLHGVLGGALAVTVAWKIRGSLPKAVRARRWGRVALGLIVSLATTAALVGGFAWVASGRLLAIGSWTVLTLHAWVGLALVPLVGVHLLPRRWRLLVPREGGPGRAAGRSADTQASRRRLLVAGGLGAVSVCVFGASQIADAWFGGVRRFTGSRWLPAGGVPPPTTFYGEAAPIVDPATWRLRVLGRVTRPIEPSLREMAALGEMDLAVVLDCTSGWAMETTWRGVPLVAVLNAAGVDPDARSVLVRSSTGWATSLTAADASRALLATAVAGSPLPVANGAPCRLVVPDHRGLDWVKWVSEVDVV